MCCHHEQLETTAARGGSGARGHAVTGRHGAHGAEGRPGGRRCLRPGCRRSSSRPPFLQGEPEERADAVAGIGHHHRRLQSRRDQTVHQIDRKPPLLPAHPPPGTGQDRPPTSWAGTTPSGHDAPSLAAWTLTATWQFAVFPNAPQYYRATPIAGSTHPTAADPDATSTRTRPRRSPPSHHAATQPHPAS